MNKADIENMTTCPLCNGVIYKGRLSGSGYGLRWYKSAKTILTIFGIYTGEKISAGSYSTTPAIRCSNCKVVMFVEGT